MTENEHNLRAEEAAVALGVSMSTFGRIKKAGLPHRRLGARTIRYARREMFAWIADHPEVLAGKRPDSTPPKPAEPDKPEG